MDTKKTRLESKIVGSIPVINHFIEKLDLEATFTRFLPREPRRGRRSKIPPAQTLLVLLRNLIVDKLALYRIPDWVRGHVPQLFGLNEGDIDSFTDERLGKALDLLYQADRRSLITQVVREAVRVFKVELRQIHNDTTTISFFGKYEGQEFLGTVLLCRGFNKDHRPDLKQLVFSVCASADEDVPVHLGLFDGNTTDDQIHCAIWDDLREFIGHSDFIYVGDCKLWHQDRSQGHNQDWRGGHSETFGWQGQIGSRSAGQARGADFPGPLRLSSKQGSQTSVGDHCDRRRGPRSVAGWTQGARSAPRPVVEGGNARRSETSRSRSSQGGGRGLSARQAVSRSPC